MKMKIEQNKMTNIQTHTHTQIVMMAKCVKKERKSKHQVLRRNYPSSCCDVTHVYPSNEILHQPLISI